MIRQQWLLSTELRRVQQHFAPSVIFVRIRSVYYSLFCLILLVCALSQRNFAKGAAILDPRARGGAMCVKMSQRPAFD